MAAGDITSTITVCEGTAAIKTYLDTESTGAATAGSDTTTFQITPFPGRDGVFIVTKIDRAAS